MIRGIAAKQNILSAIGDVTTNSRGKLILPSDVVEETIAAREHGGTRRNVEVIEVDIEETQPGYIASKLKEADQMSGQTFNDVGRIDDEGKIRFECHEKN